MREGGASRTATGVVRYRAAHQVLDDEPKILDDPISVGLVPGSSREEILKDRERYVSETAKAYREGFVTRARVAEDGLKIAVEAGIDQYVILGAGLDTFAHRQPAWARTVRIFEVDHPATQQGKRELLRQKGLTALSNLTYVACDFECMSLAGALRHAETFDDSRRAYFSWLGVVVYLTREAIEATLKDVLSLPCGSRIVFDAPIPSKADDPPRQAWLSAAARAASAGEPMITFLPLDDWKAWLVALGFSNVVHIGPEETTARYFASRRDGLRPSRHYLLCEV